MASLHMDVVLWNCDVWKDVRAEKKNASIRHVAKWIVNNILGGDLFILAQELKTTKVQDIIQTELEACGHVQADGKKSLCEALVYYVSQHEPLSNLVRQSDLRRVADTITHDPNAPDLGRLSVQKLDHPQASLLVVSWHGMWKSLSDDQLQVYLKSMMDFIEKVRQKLGCTAVIIGGDFNLPSHKAIQVTARAQSKEHCFKNATVFDEYKLPDGRSRCIDYILWWSDGSVEISKERIHVIRANKSEVGTNNFDHPVIHYPLEVHFIQVPRNLSTPAEKVKARSARGLTSPTKPGDEPYNLSASSSSPTASGRMGSRNKQESTSSKSPSKTTKAKTSTSGDTRWTTPPRDKPSTPSPTAKVDKSLQGKLDAASSKSPPETTKAKTSTAGDTKWKTPPRDKSSTPSPRASEDKSPQGKSDTALSKSPPKTTKTRATSAGAARPARDKPSTPTAAKPPRTPRPKSAASKEARKGSASGSRRQAASVRYTPEWEDFLGTDDPVPPALWERPPQSRGRARPQQFFQWSSSDTFL